MVKLPMTVVPSDAYTGIVCATYAPLLSQAIASAGV
ncbi:MAG: hypothetical protein JWO62_3331 [Acidimicrobiaceae bacterium]|nr:hypothetical protein [Acidimicrobiaceae bacterium]